MNNPLPIDKLKSITSGIKDERDSLIVTDIFAPILRDMFKLINYQNRRWGTKKRHSERMAFLQFTTIVSEFGDAINNGHDDVIIASMLSIAAYLIQWVATYWDERAEEIHGTPEMEKNGQLLVELFTQGIGKISLGALNNKKKTIAEGVGFVKSFTTFWEDADSLKKSHVKIVDTVKTVGRIEGVIDDE